MGLTDMEVNHRPGKALVAEQSADRQQVHAGFQKSGRVRMAKCVRHDGLLDPRFERGDLEGSLDRGAVDRRIGMLAWEQEIGGLVDLPVLSQDAQEPRRHRDKPILVAFSLANFEQHPIRIDVGDRQIRTLREPQPGRIERRQKCPVFGMTDTLEQPFDFLAGHDRREHLGLFAERDHGNVPFPGEGVAVEKP